MAFSVGAAVVGANGAGVLPSVFACWSFSSFLGTAASSGLVVIAFTSSFFSSGFLVVSATGAAGACTSSFFGSPALFLVSLDDPSAFDPSLLDDLTPLLRLLCPTFVPLVVLLLEETFVPLVVLLLPEAFVSLLVRALRWLPSKMKILISLNQMVSLLFLSSFLPAGPVSTAVFVPSPAFD